MRLAIITPVFSPYLAGIGRVAANEAKGLAKAGIEVKIITPQYNQQDLNLETSAGYKIVRLQPLYKFGNAAWLDNLGEDLKEAEIIHLHYPFIGGISSILRFKKDNPRVPLIMTYHMDLLGWGWRKLFFKIYTFFTLSKILTAADKIIVSSFDYAENGFLKKFIQKFPAKFSEVPFGIEINNQEPRIRNQELRQRLAIKKEDKIILFVGALDNAHYFKGLVVLLNSLLEINNQPPIVDCKLIIVGDGNQRLNYQKKVKRLGLGEKVIFTWRVGDQELGDYYNLADVLVLPSLDMSEAYGLVLLEALSWGLPMIASDLPGVRILVKMGGGLMIKPGSSSELAGAIKRILLDEEIFRKRAKIGRQLVESNKSLEIETQQLLDVYKSLA